MRATVDVLDHDFVPMQVERDAERAGSVRGRERRSLPAAYAQPQGGVLQLRLRRRQLRSELAEHLRVRVQRVARRRPLVVSQRGPDELHGTSAWLLLVARECGRLRLVRIWHLPSLAPST